MLSTQLLNKPGVLRFSGYSQELRDFLQESCKRATQCGQILYVGLQNPTNEQVQYLRTKDLPKFEMSAWFVYKALSKCLVALSPKQRGDLTTAITADIRALSEAGKSDSSINNYVMKLLCWLYYRLSQVLTKLKDDNVPIIVYASKYTFYELHLMKILADYGCCVLYIDDTSTESDYGVIDRNGQLSTLIKLDGATKFPIGWSLKSEIELAETTKDWYDEQSLANLQMDETTGYNDIPDATGLLRLHVSGVCSEYENTLFTYTQSLNNSMFLTGAMLPARPDEIVKCTVNPDTVENLLSELYKKSNLTEATKKTFHTSFYMACKKHSVTKTQKCLALYGLCMRYASMLYGGYLFILNPVLTKTDAFVIDVLSKLIVNIVLLDPSKTIQTPTGFRVEEFSGELALFQYPTGRKASSVTTVASQAESVIRDVLYDDPTGLLGGHKVQTLSTVRLDCTYEEILQLWDEPLKMRQGYKLEDDNVKAPVIFAALNGIPENDAVTYTRQLRELKEADGIWCAGDFLREYLPNVNYAECTSNKKVSVDKIINLPVYRYGHLREEVQRHLISKMQEMLDLDVMKGFGRNGTENILFQVMLSLPDMVTQELQNFKFTEKNPKLMIIRNDKEQLSMYDTIAINYMSLLGFDVVIVIPTGYSVLDKYTATKLYKRFDFGNYSYKFDVMSVGRKRFMDKLFRR